MELENTTRAEPIWDFSRDAWIERLCGFAGLNFVIGTAIRQWKQNALEILSRIGQDLPILQNTLFGGRATGMLVAMEGDLGDRHNDGRSVTFLTFASGDRVVYKPKDGGCAQKFQGLLALLNAASPSIPLSTQRILCCGSYSWEEYVAQRVATTEAEAARFFQRFGMILRVLQLLEGRDFWIDNLRVNGDSPVFIDLECIVQPRLEGEGVETPIMDLDPELYEELVLPTAAVTQPIFVPGFGKQDFGGLSSPGARVLPLGMWSGYRDRRNGNIWLKSGRLYWSPDAAWPETTGKAADPIDYLNDLETGYREMQRLLCRCSPQLRAPTSPLAGIGNVPVRALMRSTWEYLVFLRASLEPSELLDGNARELMLVNVLSTAHKWGRDDDATYRLRIARSELDAIRILDIPEFYNLPSTADLLDTSGLIVSGLFCGSACARLLNRLDNVDFFDVETHVRILKAGVEFDGPTYQRIVKLNKRMSPDNGQKIGRNHVRLRPRYKAFGVEGEGLFLVSDHDNHVLEGQIFVDLLPLLLTGVDETKAVDALERTYPRAFVHYAFEVLAERRLLTDDGDGGTQSEEAFWDELGFDASRVKGRLAATTVSITGIGPVDTCATAQALSLLGMKTRFVDAPDDESLHIVIVDDYLAPSLEQIAAINWRDKRPWLLTRGTGSEIWVGPLFGRPGACFECLSWRLRTNAVVEDYIGRKLSSQRGISAAIGHTKLHDGLVANILALEAAKWALGYVAETPRVTTIDLRTLQTSDHVLRQRPQCRVCGNPELQTQILTRPVRIGEDDETAASTVDDFAPFVSKLTGIITGLARAETGIESLYTYTVGFGHGAPDIEAFKNGLLSQGAGVGTTAEQAKVGAICEALERYSGMYHGDEPAISASYTQLDPTTAIHPGACMLYSARQYALRECARLRGDRSSKNWRPASVVSSPTRTFQTDFHDSH